MRIPPAIALLLFVSLILPGSVASGQIRDDFDDGDFSSGVCWTGDTALFIVNTSQQLQLSAPAVTDTAVLFTPVGGQPGEWLFFMKLDFAPSDNNYAKIYLMSDTPLLKGPLHGYFIRAGENGSADGIDLFRQDGEVITKLIDGVPGHASRTSNVLRIKVLRDTAGLWQLFSDTLGGFNFGIEGTATDTTFFSAACVGFYCRYTSGNASGFYFDDVYAGAEIPDSVIPYYKPLPGEVVINEVLFNPRTGGADFVELYNNSGHAADLSKLRIGSADYDLRVADDSAVISETPRWLLPQTYVVLTASPEAVQLQYATFDPGVFFQISSMPSFNDDKDVVILLDSSGNKMDEFAYTEAMHFPLLHDVEGVSLERLNPDRPASDPSNWHSAASSVGYATPGYRNSQHIDVAQDGNGLRITPEIFSPDNDGQDDVVVFSYFFSSPGFVFSAVVYDAQGRLVAMLKHHELAGAEGAFTWDGIGDTREKAPRGIYILLFEAFNTEGIVKRFKAPFVLGGKS